MSQDIDMGTDTDTGMETGAAAAATSPFHADGSFGRDWHAGLGDEFTPHAAQLATFKDVAGLAKSYIHLRGTGPAYPGDESSPEEVSRFRALARVPAEGTAEGYGISLPESATDMDRATYERIARVAHEHHLSGPGFAAVVAEFQKSQAEEIAEFHGRIEAQRVAAEDQLVSLWKGDFESNKSTVRHVTGRFAGQAGISPDDPSLPAMLQNPAFARLMLAVSRGFTEDGVRTPSGHGDFRSAAQRAEAIMSGTDPVWGRKYVEGGQEERLAAYNEVARLMGEARR